MNRKELPAAVWERFVGEQSVSEFCSFAEPDETLDSLLEAYLHHGPYWFEFCGEECAQVAFEKEFPEWDHLQIHDLFTEFIRERS